MDKWMDYWVILMVATIAILLAYDTYVDIRKVIRLNREGDGE